MLQNIVNIVSAWRLRSPEQLSQDFTETDWARFDPMNHIVGAF